HRGKTKNTLKHSPVKCEPKRAGNSRVENSHSSGYGHELNVGSSENDDFNNSENYEEPFLSINHHQRSPVTSASEDVKPSLEILASVQADDNTIDSAVLNGNYELTPEKIHTKRTGKKRRNKSYQSILKESNNMISK